MTYEIYRYIFIGGAVLSAVMLITAIVLFFALRISTVVGDLTGANARKAIEVIRDQNASTGEKTYKTSPVNRERGKITSKMTPSGHLIRESESGTGGAMATARISPQQFPQNEMHNNNTTILSEAETFTNEAASLFPPIIGSEAAVTSDLIKPQSAFSAASNYRFEIEADITFIHTNEVIS